MSISDELMWKYWVFLTDLRASEIDAMKAEVASGGAEHSMGREEESCADGDSWVSWRG